MGHSTSCDGDNCEKEFGSLLNHLHDEFQPIGTFEEWLVLKITECTWRLRRATRSENGAVRTAVIWDKDPTGGAHFRFRHLSHEKNLFENQGKAMTAISVDESTHLPLDWIRYIFTRNRSTDPDIKTRLRLGI